MTIDGCPVAVSKFIDGKIVDGVFLGNERLSVETRIRKFVALMNNMWIRRYDVTTRGKDGFMDYGAPGDLFLDQFGNVLIYQDTDNDGKSDAVTDVRLLYSFDVLQGGGSSTGYSGGGNSGDGIGGNSGGTGTGSGGGASGSGLGTGGSGSNNNTGGSGSDNTDIPTFNGRGKRLENLTVDPLKWDSWVSDGVVPSKPTEGEQEEKEEKPKADSLKCVADPLINMEILGTPVNGVKGGRFGTGRGRMHNGCDLKADVGTPVYAMFDGEITMVVDKFNPDMSWGDYEKYFDNPKDYTAGNRIWIKGKLANGDDCTIKYFHMNTIDVKIGQIVCAGDIVGTSGQTGSACSDDSGGPHLHVEAFINGQREDPEQYFYTKFDENGKPIIE